MKNLIKRSLTGIIYVALITVGVLTSRLSLNILCILLIVPGILEFERLKAEPIKSSAIKIIDIIGGLLIMTMSLPIYMAYILTRLLTELYSGDKHPISSLGHSMLGQLYVALPVALMPVLSDHTCPELLFGMFVMIWLNDTGAFCVGSLMGRHKLFERISPKKTWEGFAGGLLFTIGAAFVFKYCFGSFFPQPILWLIGMGLITGLFGTWGDLIESMIKRAVNVKDSGTLLPGHGGILDRIDSLLAVVPAMILYVYLSRTLGWL